jgi:choline dehydrogenase
MSRPLVIVGAGSSGAVIAARVTERGQRDVLLLEAGPDYGNVAALPRDLADAGRNSMIRHDWGYRHRPTTVQFAFRFPRGKVVGGSSAVNTCIALRGQPRDYDEWAARGLNEWSWEQCLPAFKRLERDLDFASPWHGNDGPLPIRRHPQGELAVWQAAFLEACKDLGFAACPDSNEPNTHGVGPHAMNKVDGRRVSVADAYLTPEVRARLNFKLLPSTVVRRIVFRDRRVDSVEIERQNKVQTIGAEEVVLCAGAVNTPGILLRSGIGPRSELERLGIDRVADVPAVGAKILDHPGCAIFLLPRFGARIDRRAPLIQTVLRYGSTAGGHGSDMLLQPGSKLNTARVDWPLVSLMCAVGKPRGHGTIRWLRAGPTSVPQIDSRLLEDPHDRDMAVEAMALAFEVAQTPILRRLASHFWPSERTLRDRARIGAWIRRGSDSGYHPCGTVPMGADDDPAAATDGRGRVRGVVGLRVADASLMPTIPSANTNLTVIMMGERFGEWLASESDGG